MERIRGVIGSLLCFAPKSSELPTKMTGRRSLFESARRFSQPGNYDHGFSSYEQLRSNLLHLGSIRSSYERSLYHQQSIRYERALAHRVHSLHDPNSLDQVETIFSKTLRAKSVDCDGDESTCDDGD